MSGRPTPEMAEQLLAVLSASMSNLASLRSMTDERKRLNAEIAKAEEREAELGKEICRLLGSMDCNTVGNYGYEGRIGWLFREMLRLDRKQREAPGAGESEGTP